MHELVRTNDAVLISAIEALLNGAGIPYMVLDQNMSVLEGSLGVLPRRVLVPRITTPRRGGCCRMPVSAMNFVPSTLTRGDRRRGARRASEAAAAQRGHRVGHDAILLAARTGEGPNHAVDLGAGIGTAGLALLARVLRREGHAA